MLFRLALITLALITYVLSIFAHAEEFDPWFIRIDSRDIPVMDYIAQRMSTENKKPADFNTSTPLNAIAFYHRYLSSSKCQFYPSCSRYGYTAINKYGLIKGMIMESERLTRCNSKAYAYGYDQIGRFLYDPPRNFWNYSWDDKSVYSATKFIQTKLATDDQIPLDSKFISKDLNLKLFDDKEIDTNMKFALYLYNERDLYRAVTEFKRYMFENSESNSVPSVYFMLAICYLQGKRYDEALKYFKWTAANSSQVELQVSAKYMQGVSLYLTGDYTNAIQAFKEVIESEIQQFTDRALFFISICHLRNNDLTNAIRSLQKVANSSKDQEILECTNQSIAIIKANIDKNRKSPFLSTAMSTLLPGAGQIYSGRTWDGITSFILNSAFTVIAFDSYKHRYWGGGLIVGYFGLSFYIGNIYGAKESAHRHNELIIDKLIEQIEQTLDAQKLSMDVRYKKEGVSICWSMLN